MKISNAQKIFIWGLCIFSWLILIDCFFFLEFWYAKRHGLENGFHIFNTDYSILHWFTKISYISCILVVIWTTWEVVGHYNENYKPKFVVRYVAVAFIVATMIGESWKLPQAMEPRWSSMMDAIFNDGPWTGTWGFWYSFLDFVQFLSIHITIPILSLIYVCIYRDIEYGEEDVKTIVITINAMMIGWWLYCGFVTLLGVEYPYPILDWTPHGPHAQGKADAFELWFQLLAFWIVVGVCNLVVIQSLNISFKYGWNKNNILV